MLSTVLDWSSEEETEEKRKDNSEEDDLFDQAVAQVLAVEQQLTQQGRIQGRKVQSERAKKQGWNKGFDEGFKLGLQLGFIHSFLSCYLIETHNHLPPALVRKMEMVIKLIHQQCPVEIVSSVHTLDEFEKQLSLVHKKVTQSFKIIIKDLIKNSNHENIVSQLSVMSEDNLTKLGIPDTIVSFILPSQSNHSSSDPLSF